MMLRCPVPGHCLVSVSRCRPRPSSRCQSGDSSGAGESWHKWHQRASFLSAVCPQCTRHLHYTVNSDQLDPVQCTLGVWSWDQVKSRPWAWERPDSCSSVPLDPLPGLELNVSHLSQTQWMWLLNAQSSISLLMYKIRNFQPLNHWPHSHTHSKKFSIR